MRVEKVDSFTSLHCGRTQPLLFNILLPKCLPLSTKTNFPLLVEPEGTQQKAIEYIAHQISLHI